VIPEILLLVKQIRPGAAQVDDLRTAVPVLLQPGTLETVKRVGDAFAATYDTLVLIVAEAAFVADADQGRRPDVAIAYGAFAVALVAETSDGNAGLLATHDEIAV
jgi:hypothetical protein